MRPLDIVQIDTGAVGIIQEVSDAQHDTGYPLHASVRWFGHTESKSAWWEIGEQGFRVIDNVASMLTEGLAHPFSSKPVFNPYLEGNL